MTTPDSRGTLAANLRRMIESDTPKGSRPSVRAWAIARGLDVRLIDRLTKAEHAITLDKLSEIAKACNLHPWQLLYEDLNPTEPPQAPITPEERAMLAKLRALLDSK